jgi:adenylosuccinate synthase
MHNDIVKLHARRMNKLCAETKKLPHLESELHELCQLWQQQRKAFTDIECTIRHKLQDSDRNGITALRQRRSVLHDRLKSDKVIIEAKESYIIDVKDGTYRL